MGVTHKAGMLRSLSAGALLLALTLLVISALVLNVTLTSLSDSRKLVERTNAIARQMAELQASLREAEAGQRGFVLTGEPRYLRPYESAVRRIPMQFDRLRALVMYPVQIERLNALWPLIDAKLAELAQTVALRSRSFDEALAVIRTDEGQRMMEEIDVIIESFQQTQRDLLEIRAAEEQRRATWTTGIAAGTGFMSLLCALLSVFFLIEQRGRERLVASEERFRQLAENIQEVFWIWDPHFSRFLYVNPAFERVWGRPREAVYEDIGKWFAPIHPEDRARVEGHYFSLTNVSDFDDMFIIRRDDGTTRRIRNRGWPVDAGARDVRYLVGVAQDITEIHNAQQALLKLNEDLEEKVEERTTRLKEVNLELDAFAYTISHDLRAPLRAMHGYADAIMEDYAEALPEDGRFYAQRIVAVARHMDGLIEDLLTYSRLSREEITSRPVSLEVVVDEIIVALAPHIEQTGATVEVLRPLPEVKAHISTLRQIIDNLLSNAIKFVSRGVNPRVRLWAQRNGERIRLFVEDNGIGIEPEHLGRIFNAFERLHGIEAYPGTGIGLAIVRKGVERMCGTCGVSSVPGKGSCFWIELPAARNGNGNGNGA